MIYGELGRYPLEIQMKSRIISYWSRILNTGKDAKIAKLIYDLGICMNHEIGGKIHWYENIKHILNNCG